MEFKHSYLYFLLSVTLIISTSSQACGNCVGSIQLNAEEWQCLERKLPLLLDTGLNLIIIRLGENECASGEVAKVTKSGDAIPPRSSGNVNPKNKFFLVSKQHGKCIQDQIGQIVASHSDRSFIFSKECTK